MSEVQVLPPRPCILSCGRSVFIIKREMQQLYKVIDSRNRELAIDGGGSQDAVNDPEWAIHEGIDTIEYTDEALQEIILGCDYDINKSVSVLNECLDTSIILNYEVIKKTLDRNGILKTFVVYADLKDKNITSTVIKASSEEQAIREMDLIYNEDCKSLITEVKEGEMKYVGFFPI